MSGLANVEVKFVHRVIPNNNIFDITNDIPYELDTSVKISAYLASLSSKFFDKDYTDYDFSKLFSNYSSIFESNLALIEDVYSKNIQIFDEILSMNKIENGRYNYKEIFKQDIDKMNKLKRELVRASNLYKKYSSLMLSDLLNNYNFSKGYYDNIKILVSSFLNQEKALNSIGNLFTKRVENLTDSEKIEYIRNSILILSGYFLKSGNFKNKLSKAISMIPKNNFDKLPIGYFGGVSIVDLNSGGVGGTGTGGTGTGGVLVYSVCTVTASESIDHGVPAGFDVVGREGDADLPPLGDEWSDFGIGTRVLPHHADTDGMVLIRYRRRYD